MSKSDNSKVLLGSTVYCNLTHKPMMVQKIHYKTDENPMYVTEERAVDRLTVRYLSQKHDEFKITEVYLYEISLTKPNNHNGK